MPRQDFSGKMAPGLFETISKIYARPLPRVYAIFLFAIEQPEPWLTTQWQTEK